MALTPASAVPGAAPPAMPVDRAVYASLTRRFTAALIDLLFVALLCFGSGMLLGGVFGLARVSPGRAVLIAMVVGWLIAAVYKIGLQCSEFQATIGKLALGIKVTDREGRRLTLLRSMARYAGELVSAVSMTVGYVMAGFTGRRQALHDVLAGTLVVRRDVTHERLAVVPEAPRLSVLTRVLLVLFSVLWVGLTLLAVSMPALQRLRAVSTGHQHGIAPMPRSPDELSRARALVKRVLEATQVYQGEIAAQLESGVPFAEVTSPAFQYGLSSDLPFVESIDAVKGSILVVFTAESPQGIAGHQLALVPARLPSGQVVWICGHGPRPDKSTLPFEDYGEYTSVAPVTLPANCRLGSEGR